MRDHRAGNREILLFVYEDMRASTTQHNAGLRCSFVISNRLISSIVVLLTCEAAFRIINIFLTVWDDDQNAHALSVSRDMLTETPPSFCCASSVNFGRSCRNKRRSVGTCSRTHKVCALLITLHVKRIYMNRIGCKTYIEIKRSVCSN